MYDVEYINRSQIEDQQTGFETLEEAEACADEKRREGNTDVRIIER
jgi:hypothetical protein